MLDRTIHGSPGSISEVVATIANVKIGDPSQQAQRATTLPIILVAFIVCLGETAAIIAASHLAAMIDGAALIVRVLPIIIACFAAIAYVSGAYDLDSLLYFKRAWPRVANGWLGSIVGLAALVVALDMTSVLPLKALALWLVAGLLSIAVARMILIIFVRRLKRRGAFQGRTAIVGIGTQGIQLADHVAQTDDLAVSLVGFFSDCPPLGGEIEALPLSYLGGLPDLVDAVRAGKIDKVLVALPWSDHARLKSVVDRLSSTPVEIRLAPDRAGFAYARCRVASLGGLSVITLVEQPLTAMQLALKATEDRVIAAVALILLSPLMGLAVLAIRLTSPGPLLFRQSREGFNCKPFNILKFRTMHVEIAPPSEMVQAMRHDPRVTPVGALLRRTSIDELPQLFNVLLGHMSLVGPRPHAPATRAGGKLFAEVAARYAARHNVKPGLTGWAQVCGWRGETTTEEKLIKRLEHDMYYIEHWSVWFDLYIIGRTAFTILGQRNVY